MPSCREALTGNKACRHDRTPGLKRDRWRRSVLALCRSRRTPAGQPHHAGVAFRARPCQPWHRARCRKMRKKASDHVILSEAKDLLFFVFDKKQQMLRFRQHDRIDFFRSLQVYMDGVFAGGSAHLITYRATNDTLSRMHFGFRILNFRFRAEEAGWLIQNLKSKIQNELGRLCCLATAVLLEVDSCGRFG